MKVVTPEISWHEREPIYSVDFQPGSWPVQRVASAGIDKIVRIWKLTVDGKGNADFEFLSNLRRHTATVNVVRFSKDGTILATAGDDTFIILWKLSDVSAPPNNIFAEDDAADDKETWVCYKTLRGHLGDIADLSWSTDNRFLVSGSVDNSAIVWDVNKGSKCAFFNEHKSYVQGVTFDPLGNFVATLSADRSLRIYNISSKNCIHNVSKMPPLPPSNTVVSLSSASTTTPNTEEKSQTSTPQPEPKPKAVRIFHDDGLQSFFRRLEFSPDGQLLLTPAGCMEVAEKTVNASFVFSRAAFSKPALYLPCGEKSSTVVRWNPQLFQLRSVEGTEDQENEGKAEWEKKKSLFCLPYRMVYAVATDECVLIYDTQQTLPIGLLKNIHYHQHSDLSWTSNGRSLIISSVDGFCSVATFQENELGVPYTAELPQEPVKANDDIKVKRSSRKQTPLSSSSSSPSTKNTTPDKNVQSQVKEENMEVSESEKNNSTASSSLTGESKTIVPSTQNKTVESASTSEMIVEDSVKDLTISEQGSVASLSQNDVTEKSPANQKPTPDQDAPAPKTDNKKKRIQFTTLSFNK